MNILVADDDITLLTVLQHTLTNAGHKVWLAENGDIVMQTLVRNSIDLLLLDIFMPKQDGIETINMVRSTNTNIKIIAMSAGASASLQQFDLYLTAALDMGADAALQKPFSMELLHQKINSLLPVIAES